MPSEYALVTSRLLWYPTAGGFEVEVPLAEWYARHQRASALRCDDWEAFVDPHETTYARYVAERTAREAYADGVLRTIERKGTDGSLAGSWVSTLERLLPVARFPAHGLQMIAAYVGQIAPSGKIVVACAFQAADEIRRIHRFTERAVQLRRACPGFGVGGRAAWENDAAWQPLREAIEHALVVWDWGEALVAWNVCIAPLFDDVLMSRLPEIAKRRGDPMLGAFLASLEEDCLWHRDWIRALLAQALQAHEENRSVLDAWLRTWVPKARAGVEALDAIFAPDSVFPEARCAHDAWLTSLGLTPP
jgi:toluene monooxygenase system protein E